MVANRKVSGMQTAAAPDSPGGLHLAGAWLLPWWAGFLLAAALFGTSYLLRRADSSRARRVAPFFREGSLVAVLYSMWVMAGDFAHHAVAGAFDRARWIDHFERWLHLPAEQDFQGPLLAHPLIAQGANLYYAAVHLPSMGIFLIWLFWRHRSRYGPIRTVVAVYILMAALIQLIGVAPPRLLPELGFVDIAAQYHQSMYGEGGFAAGQLLAMPSEHVGWAVLIAGSVILVGTTWKRWLILIHPIITGWVVVATGNHWWLDGIVSILMIAVILGVRQLILRVRSAERRTSAERQPVVSA